MPAGLRIALRHLTTLPLPWDASEEHTAPARSLPYFPVVGVIVGAAVAGVLALPLPVLPRAALALAVWTVLTGGLHEDAWMDTADGAFAIASRERRLEILKDPHVGAHAVTALGLALLVRFATLTTVPIVAPVAAALCGRWTMATTVARFPPARPEGLGATFAKDARILPITIAGLALAGALAGFGGARSGVAIAIGLLAGLACAGWLTSRFGGLTGDGHGAAGYAAETCALLVFLPIG